MAKRLTKVTRKKVITIKVITINEIVIGNECIAKDGNYIPSNGGTIIHANTSCTIITHYLNCFYIIPDGRHTGFWVQKSDIKFLD